MSETDPDSVPTDSPMFRAGWIAVERGWNDASLALPADLEQLAPTGPPLVVVASAADVTVHHSRTLAAVASAGRNVMLAVFEGEIDDDAAKWLGDRVEVVDLSRDEHDEHAAPSTTEELGSSDVPRPAAPLGGDYCALTWGAVSPSDVGNILKANRYLDRLTDTLHLKGVRDGLCFAALMPSSPAGMASWIEFSSASSGGQDYFVIETPIGASAAPESVWTPEATASFAWHAVRWCEQPAAGDGGKRHRWFKRSADSPTLPVPQADCFPKDSPPPLRRLSASDSLVAFRHEPSSLQEPVELGSQTPIFFEYWIPLHEWDVFKAWSITAVTSLLRMLHLLQDPGWAELPGRDARTESSAVEQLKASLGFNAYGDLAVRAFDDRHKAIRSIALADGSMTEAEFEALDLVETPLSQGPPLNTWPPT